MRQPDPTFFEGLAAWWREWARLAGNAGERQKRMRLAAYFDEVARQTAENAGKGQAETDAGSAACGLPCEPETPGSGD